MLVADSTEQSILDFLEFMMLSKRHISEVGADCDLTSMQTITLLMLAEPRSMHSLKELFNCDASNITGIVDGLEQKELAQRSGHPSDRRIKLIELTDRGKHVRRQLIRKLADHPRGLISQLSQTDYRQLMLLLQKVKSQ